MRVAARRWAAAMVTGSLVGASAVSGDVPAAEPRVFLWAWERPERLDFLDTRRVGVAFLAATVRQRSGGVEVLPRRQPLTLAPGTARMAVVRVEVEPGTAPSEALRERVREVVGAQVRRYGLETVQVDYDARLSERPFYRGLLHALRESLPAGVRLSMTALASWCLDDDWLEGLPVDEVVPMVFRMGVDAASVRAELARRGDFRSPRCRQSVGLVTDEPVPTLPAGRRTYWFNPRSWSAEDLAAVLGEQQT